ncbi:hypothetical protein JSZ92_004322 [Salmonella enterica subsp. enterica]|nr:hypothetical protein [Salmonella enterica subsp. enterica serovar Montevideo]EDX0904478.1 hypothetical protein [Salmonella enterica subsp. enterica]EEN9966757.1 hypothetical protein [Salmonella enterica subsp. enterica]EHC6701977.1 hypothetical protein [Salmonella enterica subsp. enterica]EKC4132904.1 hypothetical protein [Salmonella enterica subsp. enterica]
MMKKVMLPADAEQYAEMVEHEISELRRKMGGACITLNYRTAIMNAHPVLVMDFLAKGDGCTHFVMTCRLSDRSTDISG